MGEGQESTLLKDVLNEDGQIADQDVAHEVYSTIDDVRQKQGVSAEDKVKFFEEHGNDILLIGQAGKTVRVEREREHFEQKSKRDRLTGMLGQEAFREIVADELQSVKEGKIGSVGVTRWDLNNFSWINDVFKAHRLGDVFLQQTAVLVEQALRQPDDEGARIGGDEFGCIFRGIAAPGDFRRAVTRVYQEVNENLVTKSLEVILQSDRRMDIGGGHTEREGTVILKEMLSGLKRLHEDVDAQAHFLDKGRGASAHKKELIKKISAIDFSVYDDYIADTRRYDDLNIQERGTREETEVTLVNQIVSLLSRISISGGALFVTKDNVTDFERIDKRLDEAVYTVKEGSGGSGVAFIA